MRKIWENILKPGDDDEAGRGWGERLSRPGPSEDGQLACVEP